MTYKKDPVEKARKMGRPQVGDVVLPAVTISHKIDQALRTAAYEGMTSVPNIRRAAYKKFLKIK